MYMCYYISTTHMPVSSDGVGALLLLPLVSAEAGECAPAAGAMEIMGAARPGSHLYVRLSRSLQSPSGCHRAGRSACAPATRRCTPGGSGARTRSISWGSLQSEHGSTLCNMSFCSSPGVEKALIGGHYRSSSLEREA